MELENILKQMTLEEKIALCSGRNFWESKAFPQYGVPSFFMCDGPHGLRKQENVADMLGVNASRPATCFPAEVTTAGSWESGAAGADRRRHRRGGAGSGRQARSGARREPQAEPAVRTEF